jgi:hypothetical protein
MDRESRCAAGPGIKTMNTATRSVSRQLLLICALSTFAATTLAGSITIDSAESGVINQMYVINAEVEFAFSDDALEAMRSGIALFIDVDFRIKRRRPYIWDPSVLKLSRRYRIERHALTDRYVITDLVTDDRRIHDSLEAAIQDLGRIREVPIAEEAAFDSSLGYLVGLRARLDIESLPGPLRPIAYISPSWRMSSGWYQWTLTP